MGKCTYILAQFCGNSTGRVAPTVRGGGGVGYLTEKVGMRANGKSKKSKGGQVHLRSRTFSRPNYVGKMHLKTLLSFFNLGWVGDWTDS